MGKVEFIFRLLYEYYGPQHWWPADSSFEMMIGAILVQNTNWKNAEKAINRLKPYLTPEKIDCLSEEELAELIRPSGFYRVKAKRICAFLAWFKKYDYNIENLKAKNFHSVREDLLTVNGIGKETADCILLYALNKPVFVVDAYARRIFTRIGFDLSADYDKFRKQIEAEFPLDSQKLNEYHALLVEHGKQFCRKKPKCDHCPLQKICDFKLHHRAVL